MFQGNETINEQSNTAQRKCVSCHVTRTGRGIVLHVCAATRRLEEEKLQELEAVGRQEVRRSLYVVSAPSPITKTSLLCTWVHVTPVCTEDLCSGEGDGVERLDSRRRKP